MALQEYQLDHATFDLWLMGEGEDNRVELDKVKRILPIILDECCTATQKAYIIRYFVDKMPIPRIAKEYGVNKSTVSRTIRAGLDRAYGYLRFASPLFIKSPQKRGYLSRKDG